MLLILKNINKFLNKINNDNISEYAAECAYFTILSFVPFIFLIFTLIQYTNFDKEYVISILDMFFPNNMKDIFYSIIQEVYSKSLGTFSIAVIVTIWSSGKGFFSLLKGLRRIYMISDDKSNFRIRIEGTIFTLLFIILMIGMILIQVFGNAIYNSLSKNFRTISTIISYILKMRILFIITILFLAFLFIYKFIPNNNQKIKYQIYGAFLVSIGWYILSWFFSIYINIFKGFSKIYGSLSTIVLIMMWVYACMYLILLGGELNNFIQEKAQKLEN